MLAKRTMEGRLVPTWFAKSETVPKARRVGSANTASAIRRSVGVSSPLAAATRSNVEVSGARMSILLQYHKSIVQYVTLSVVNNFVIEV